MKTATDRPTINQAKLKLLLRHETNHFGDLQMSGHRLNLFDAAST